MYKLLIVLYIDVTDNKGESPLDVALRPNTFKKGSVEAIHYLICHGSGTHKDKAKLLCEACHWGYLNIVKELVEQHQIDPICEY